MIRCSAWLLSLCLPLHVNSLPEVCSLTDRNVLIITSFVLHLSLKHFDTCNRLLLHYRALFVGTYVGHEHHQAEALHRTQM